MADAKPATSPVDDASLDESAAQSPAETAVASRKRVSERGKKASTRRSRSTSKGTTRAGATGHVRVGSDTIVVPKALAADLSQKDLKKLRAIFKRAGKRAKKRATGKRAAKPQKVQ